MNQNGCPFIIGKISANLFSTNKGVRLTNFVFRTIPAIMRESAK